MFSWHLRSNKLCSCKFRSAYARLTVINSWFPKQFSHIIIMQLGYYVLNWMVSQSVRSSNPNGSGFTLVLSGGPRVSIHFPYWWSPSCSSLENPPSYIMRICLIIVTSLIFQHLALELEMPHVGLCLYASNKRTLMVLLILFFSPFNSSLNLVLYCGVSTLAGSVGSEFEHPMTLCLKNSIGYLNRELS